MTQLLIMSMLAGAIIAGATIMLTRDLQRATLRRRIRENHYKGFKESLRPLGVSDVFTIFDETAGRDITYWRKSPDLTPHIEAIRRDIAALVSVTATSPPPCRTCRILSHLGLDNHVRHHHPKHRGRA